MSVFLLGGLGLLVGFLSSFLGVGGGILTIPALYALFPGVVPEVAIACSLGLIFFNSIFNIFYMVRDKRRPVLRFALPLGLATGVGVWLGGQIVFLAPPTAIKRIFASVLILMMIRNIFWKKKVGPDFHFAEKLAQASVLIPVLFGLCAGLISGLTGLGGGLIFVPLLILVFKMPPQFVPLYSNIGMLCGSLVGVLTYTLMAPKNIWVPRELLPFQLGYLNYLVVFLIFLGSMFTAKWGVYASGRVGPKLSQYVFNSLLILIVVKILFF